MVCVMRGGGSLKSVCLQLSSVRYSRTLQPVPRSLAGVAVAGAKLLHVCYLKKTQIRPETTQNFLCNQHHALAVLCGSAMEAAWPKAQSIQ